MRRIDWESKRPKLDLLLGKKTGPEIAQILDVSLTSLRWYCQKRSLSLFLDGKRRHTILGQPRKPRKVRESIRNKEPMALERLPTLSVDPERLWQIPAMPFKHVYMGNFT